MGLTRGASPRLLSCLSAAGGGPDLRVGQARGRGRHPCRPRLSWRDQRTAFRHCRGPDKVANAPSGLAGAFAKVDMLTVGVASAVGAALGKIGVSNAVAGALGQVGFTSEGIAAGSWVAKWMSSSAIANGGGVAAGSWMAKLQSVATLGLGSTASVVVGAAVVGGASYAIASSVTSPQRESMSALEPAKSLGELWVVATSEGWGGVYVSRYETRASARATFEEVWCPAIWCSKVLFDPYGREMASSGQNERRDGIRKVMSNHYFRMIYLAMEIVIAVVFFISTILAVLIARR